MWQILAYNPLGIVGSAHANIYATHPQLLITTLPNSPTLSNIVELSMVNYRCQPYNYLPLKLRVHWLESYKIFT